MAIEGRSLNVIGCGAAASALLARWISSGAVKLQGICNSTPASASRAISSFGTGRSYSSIEQLESSELWMIGTPDDRIAEVAEELAANGRASRGNVVFHLSGALDSTMLTPLAEIGCVVGSLHPVQTFPQRVQSVDQSVNRFSHPAVPWCALEGEAIETLIDLSNALGAKHFVINREQKLIYHSALVIASNYLPVLIDLASKILGSVGLQNRELEILQPLVTRMVDNIFSHGPAAALTGPINRADWLLVSRQLALLKIQHPSIAGLYAALGLHALNLVTTDDFDKGIDLELLAGVLNCHGRIDE